MVAPSAVARETGTAPLCLCLQDDKIFAALFNMGWGEEYPQITPEQVPAVREQFYDGIGIGRPRTTYQTVCPEGHLHDVLPDSDLEVWCSQQAKRLQTGAPIRIFKKECAACCEAYRQREIERKRRKRAEARQRIDLTEPKA